ncbi:hypothetical protein RND81_10G178300 [Saponaria officinalis]|uniref:Endonuclease V n=1 Tax=Saponaria officinalis TaxID=3572 RepID=A0AAW1I4Z6_SAPOF
MEQESVCSSHHQTHWIQIQDELKKRVMTEDDFSWELQPSSSCSIDGETKEVLKYIGGVDISYLKEDPSFACAILVVLEFGSFNLVYHDFVVSKLLVPYVPGFLAFREVPVLLKLIEKMKSDAHPFYPQLLMVDGNGLLHPRGFGLACHLGVLADLPTIGVGKNLHHVEGLNHTEVRKNLEASNEESTFLTGNSGRTLGVLHHVEGLNHTEVRKNLEASNEESTFLTGNSGRTLGVAVRSSGASKPIFVSVGHRISLTTALEIVKMTCKYRVPEPIRQADIRSREYLRQHAFVPSSP